MICDEYTKDGPVQVGMWDADRGTEIMRDAIRWISENPEEWQEFIRIARRWSASRKVSARDAAVYVRNECMVSIPNAITPALGRIAERTCKDLQGKFTRARSVTDEVEI